MNIRESVEKTLYNRYEIVLYINLNTGDVNVIREKNADVPEGSKIVNYEEYYLDLMSRVEIHPSDVEEVNRICDRAFIRDSIANGVTSFTKRIRYMNDKMYHWMEVGIRTTEAYSSENPYVVLTIMHIENSMNIYEDTLVYAEENFVRILRIYLQQDRFVNIKKALTNDTKLTQTSFEDLVNDCIKQGVIHSDDVEEFVRVTDLDYLKSRVAVGKTGSYAVVRMLVDDEYRWVSLDITRSVEYSDDNQVIIALIRDVNEQQDREIRERKEIEEYVLRDPLTGLQNRLAYTNCCTNYAMEESKHSIGVIFCDVNGLKYVNDNYGHKSGDEYLMTFADQLKKAYGVEHSYRISGDEFLVVFEYLTKVQFAKELGKLKRFLNSQPSPMASLGAVWLIAPKEMERVERNAEMAMYTDKQAYYKKYHKISRDDLGMNKAVTLDIEQILSDQADIGEDAKSKAIDTTGLSSRIFDVFSATTRKSYYFLSNLRTNVCRWSKRAVEDFDLPGEYIADSGNIWKEYIHPDDLKVYEDNIRDALTGVSDRHEMTFRARNAKGEYVTLSCEAAVIKGTGDEPDYFVGIVTNLGLAEEN